MGSIEAHTKIELMSGLKMLVERTKSDIEFRNLSTKENINCSLSLALTEQSYTLRIINDSDLHRNYP